MDLSSVLSVSLGLIFLFTIVALVTSAIAELIATVFRMRANHLKRAIKGMIGDTTAEDLYDSKLVKSLKNPRSLWRRKETDPSYMESGDFQRALSAVLELGPKIEDLVKEGGDKALTDAAAASDLVDNLPDGEAKVYLADLVKAGALKLGEIDKHLSHWFDSVMARASGWYKRWTNAVIFFVALALAVLLNINTALVAEELWQDPSLRAGVEAGITERLSDAETLDDLVGEIEELEALNFPIGWTSDDEDPRFFGPWTIVGWLLTAAAATLGAPFWFDLLKKAANLKGTGVVPKSTADLTKPPPPLVEVTMAETRVQESEE